MIPQTQTTQEIREAQALLLRRRGELNITPNPQAAANLPAQSDDLAYFLALWAGEDTGCQKVTITGRGDKWRAFDDERHPKLKAAVKAVKEWYVTRLQDKDTKLGCAVVLAGRNGCGKTHLAQAVCELYGYGAVYWTEIKLIEAIQDTYNGNGTAARIIKQIERAPLFIYDDLGAYQTKNAEWIQSIYLDLFNQRCEAGKPFMITTNLDDGEGGLEDVVGPRLYSRLCGAVHDKRFYVDMFGVPDYRQRGFAQ